MKNINLIFVFLLISQFVFTQNLIKNGGFETNLGIPNLPGQYYLCTDWNNCFGFGSPDYFHLDGSGSASLPSNYVSNLSPFEGAASMGLFLYESDSSVTDFREYLSQELSEPLVIGQNYQLTFYISNGKGPFSLGGYACDNFAVAFSTTPLFQSILPNHWVIDYTPQYIYDGFLYSNEWQKISYEFKADSSYQHITFGSFVNDTEQELMFFDTASLSAGVNYYIDNVSLKNITSTSTNAENNLLTHINIYPNPFTDYLSIESTVFENHLITIYDATGKELISQSFDSSLILNTIDLSEGIYYYQLKSQDSIFKSGKLIKVAK